MKWLFRSYVPKCKRRIVIWHGEKIVYLRVPKSGNTSLRAILEGGSQKTADLSLYPDYKIFSFVRNPWARLVSGYKEKLSQPELSGQPPAKRLRKIDKRFRAGMRFEEFAELISMLPDNRTEKHFRSQSYLLKHEGELIPDFIGHLEQIEHDWPLLQEAMGVQLHLRHANKTGGADYRTYYSDAGVRDLVANRYAEDISTFGYEFDNG